MKSMKSIEQPNKQPPHVELYISKRRLVLKYKIFKALREYEFEPEKEDWRWEKRIKILKTNKLRKCFNFLRRLVSESKSRFQVD